MDDATTCGTAACPGQCGGTRRPEHLKRALALEYATVGWNVVEGVVAVAAALAAGSVALLGFGIDSFVECVSGGVMIWRLRAEQAGASEQKLEQTEYTARKGVAAALALLASYVVVDAVGTLWKREHPRPSAVGIALTALSLGVMWWLAREKRRVAAAIASRAMEADAFQTTACWWLSLAALVGMALNGAFGLWWADPVAGLVVAVLVASEARGAWRGDDCC